MVEPIENRDPISVRFRKGQVLFKEDEVGHYAYVIEEGTVEISKTRNGNRIVIGYEGPGAIIGEMALAGGGRRSATVIAAEDCQVRGIKHDDLTHMLDKNDKDLIRMFQVLIRRLQTMNNVLVESHRDLADVEEAFRVILDNFTESIPEDKLPMFQQEVVPKLQELYQVLRKFK